MIIFYTMNSAGPNIRKVSIILREIGLPYTVNRVEKQGDGKFPDEFMSINPNTTVPAISERVVAAKRGQWNGAGHWLLVVRELWRVRRRDDNRENRTNHPDAVEVGRFTGRSTTPGKRGVPGKSTPHEELLVCQPGVS